MPVAYPHLSFTLSANRSREPREPAIGKTGAWCPGLVPCVVVVSGLPLLVAGQRLGLSLLLRDLDVANYYVDLVDP
jgi:hypothetical protein